MPSLTPEEQARMLGDERICNECGRRLSKNYCRQCDEFFNEGHASDCSQREQGMGNTDHAGHRTY
jgi:predicted amidophosphoribosyltransferase